MKTRRFLLSVGGLAVLGASVTWAHHSVPGRYDYENEITLKGTITQVDWINPHIRIHIDVPGDDGSKTTWELSSAPPAFLRRAGVSGSMVANDGGEPVEVFGIRAHDPGLNHMWVYRVTYADGHFYQMSIRRPTS